MRGALFGLVAYAAYDLTNQAAIRSWPLIVSVVDMAWGAALCALTTWVSVWAGRRLAPNSA